MRLSVSPLPAGGKPSRGAGAGGAGTQRSARRRGLDHERALAAAHHPVAACLALEGGLAPELARSRGELGVFALEGVEGLALLVGGAALREPLLERRGVEAEHDREQNEQGDPADAVPADSAVTVEAARVTRPCAGPWP